MIKLKLKRRISGKAIKKDKRLREKLELVPVGDSDGTVNYINVPKYRSQSRRYWKNNPSGKKYKRTLYDLENEGIGGTTNEYVFERCKSLCKNSQQIKRLYKVFPYFHPDAVKQREHDYSLKQWQAKLKKNELIQNQNRTKGKR